MNVLSDHHPDRLDLTHIISEFLFSIGASLEDCNVESSEEILIRYATNPTLGNALMAQAKQMKETWTVTERKS